MFRVVVGYFFWDGFIEFFDVVESFVVCKSFLILWKMVVSRIRKYL